MPVFRSCALLWCALLSLTAASVNAGEPTPMDEETLLKHGEREIVELHQFFQDWYRGRDDVDFERFNRALSPGFVIVMPDARILGREVIVDAVRQQRDSDPEARLEIRNVQLHMAGKDHAVLTYEEWQGRGGDPMRGRLSTVVFTFDNDAPNGLIWLHVHETWLPEDARESTSTD